MPNEILDCTSPEAALESLARLLGFSRSALRCRLEEFRTDWEHPTLSAAEQLVRRLGFPSSREVPVPGAIRWFHATRTFPGTTFSDGLLPTEAALEVVWDRLKVLALGWISEKDWHAYREGFDTAGRRFAEQFRRKADFASAQSWQGPCAFLVRDAAVGLVGSHRDFTAMPEAIEDICLDFEDSLGLPLKDAFRAATRPCLVIFTRPGGWHGAVEAALSYTYRSALGIGQSHECNTCFDAKGVPVPPSWIDEIQWL